MTGSVAWVTDITSWLDGAVLLVTQVKAGSAVTIQLTTSPSTRVFDENTGLLVPACTLFIYHWYDGLLPASTASALNVTVAPAQTCVALAVIETSGVTAVVPVTIIALDV